MFVKIIRSSELFTKQDINKLFQSTRTYIAQSMEVRKKQRVSAGEIMASVALHIDERLEEILGDDYTKNSPL